MKTITGNNESNLLNLFNPHAEIMDKHDSSFAEKSLEFFERAIEEANKGMIYSAIDTARDALVMTKYSRQYVAPYVHGFLAQLLLETAHKGAAAFHAEMAIAKLNPENSDFREDKKYYTSLLSTIRHAA